MARRGGTTGQSPEASEPGTREYRIFLSHATADKWVAKAICDKLDAVGAKTFRDDRDIDGGDKIPKQIAKEIRRCKELVVLLTPRSYDRPWVLLEIGMACAMARNPRIVPVLYHAEVGRIPEMISEQKAIDLNELDEFVEQVRKRVERHKP